MGHWFTDSLLHWCTDSLFLRCIGVFLYRSSEANGAFGGGMSEEVNPEYCSGGLAREKELLVYLDALLLSCLIGALVYLVGVSH